MDINNDIFKQKYIKYKRKYETLMKSQQKGGGCNNPKCICNPCVCIECKESCACCNNTTQKGGGCNNPKCTCNPCTCGSACNCGDNTNIPVNSPIEQ